MLQIKTLRDYLHFYNNYVNTKKHNNKKKLYLYNDWNNLPKYFFQNIYKNTHINTYIHIFFYDFL